MTARSNAQGLCEACNYVKALPGWAAREGPRSRIGDHVVELITPTGHVHPSRAPTLHRALAPSGVEQPGSVLERELARVLRLHSAA